MAHNAGQKALIRLLPWRGTLNTVINPSMADPQQIAESLNNDRTEDGTMKKRGGTKKFNQVPVITTAAEM
jgi:hypothetical protein